MRNKSLYKDIFRTIKKSFGRFISIICLMALGTLFFVGLRLTGIDMRKTSSDFYNKHHLYDIKLTNSYGLSKSDRDLLDSYKQANKIEYSYFSDNCLMDNRTSYRIYSLSKDISTYELVNGQMPLNDNEIVLSSMLENKYQINDMIEFSKNDNDLLKIYKYKIVGFVKSGEITNKNASIGQTNIGTGQLDGFGVIKASNFKSDVYMEAKLVFNNTKELSPYDDNYDSLIVKHKDDLISLFNKQDVIRLAELKKKPQEKIDAAKKKISDARNEIDINQKKLVDASNELEKAKREVESNKKLLISNKKKIDENKSSLNNLLKVVNKGISDIELALTNPLLDNTSKTSLQKKLDDLNKQKNSISNALKKIGDNEKEIIINQKKLDEASKEIVLNEKNYYSNLFAFNSKKEEVMQEIAKNEKDLNDAQNKLDKLKLPVYDFSTREDIAGYSRYNSFAVQIEVLANVFPLVAYSIAILLSLTTMTRMVEENRLYIGTLKALGYRNWDIKKKFIYYALLAGVIGAIIGTLIGQTYIPKLIYNAYASTSTMGDLKLTFDPFYLVISIIIAMLCTVLATNVVCSKQLRENPASLLQAKPPKKGSKIFLERIAFIWKRLGFIYKVTARNLFRYKLRMLMNIIGVAGCMALLIMGFGIRDSVNGVASNQYSKYTKYDMLVIKNDDLSNDENSLLIKNINDLSDVGKSLELSYKTVHLKDNKYSASMLVSNDISKLNDFIGIYDSDNKMINFSDDGIIISEKLASLMKVKKGDTLSIKDDLNREHKLKISSIMQNYFGHYLIMNDNYYQKVFNNKVYNNAIFINVNNNSNIKDVAYNIMKNKDVKGLSDVSYLRIEIDNMMGSLNRVIIVIILLASLLAITVIYNLTNINIEERIRELSTIKVLGFYHREVTAYIYRETFILSLIGMFIGYFIGRILFLFIIDILPADYVLFDSNLYLSNIIMSASITLVIIIIIMFIVHFHLKKINMLDALKSVD